MNGRAILVTSGKGGVGKTTVVANLGAALAKAGRSVALLDLNFGLRDLDCALGLERVVSRDISDVLSSRCSLNDVMVRDDRFGDLYLVPAARGAFVASSSQRKKMVKLVGELRSRFDYVIIDAPNGHGDGFQIATALADEVLLVATPEIATIRKVNRTISLLSSSNVTVVGLVLNRIRPRMVRRGDMLTEADTAELLAVTLVGLLPEDEDVASAMNRGVPLAGTRRLGAAARFRDIADRIEGGTVSDTKPWDGKGIFARLGLPFGRQTGTAVNGQRRIARNVDAALVSSNKDW